MICGIDEAGYGPLLGPLCVAAAALRVDDWREGDPAPDLWAVLARGVARRAGEARGRLLIADSKKAKLANDSRTRHPLVHLEAAALGAIHCAGEGPGRAPFPEDDRALFDALGVRLESHAWYAGPPTALPVGGTREALGIRANALASVLEERGVGVLSIRCAALGEGEFNGVVRRTRSKAEATIACIGAHLRHALGAFATGRWGRPGDHLRIVCDRLGGREQYAGMLERELNALPGLRAAVRPLAEGPALSRYEAAWPALPGSAGPGRAVIAFAAESEDKHLPVALASMVAKYVRELAMLRFNRYWCSRIPEIKPTAGYWQDARRWLREAAAAITPDERRAMVRIA